MTGEKSRAERLALLVRPEVMKWEGTGAEPKLQKMFRLGVEAYLDGDAEKAGDFFGKARVAEGKILRGERESGRPRGTKRVKNGAEGKAIAWGIAEGKRSHRTDAYTLAWEAMDFATLKPKKADDRFRMRDRIGRKIAAGLRG